jgi:hypothetical protein
VWSLLAVRVVRVDLEDTAARPGVPVQDVEGVHRLAGDGPSVPLPAKAEAPAILARLAVRPEDAAEIMAGWPDPDSPLWTVELRWLDADVEVLRFVFRTLTTSLDQLPRRTTLQRAIIDLLKTGRHWHWHRGHFPI